MHGLHLGLERRHAGLRLLQLRLHRHTPCETVKLMPTIQARPHVALKTPTKMCA
jgi:hypothetical protein